jgi:hypothetical protein
VQALRRQAAGFICVLAVALMVAAAAVAGSKASAPPPTLSSLALSTPDFHPGAKVAKEKTQQQSGGVVLFERIFGPGARIGSGILLAALSETLMYPDSGTATVDFASLKSILRTKKGRAAFAKEIASGFASGAHLKVKKTSVGTPVIGAQAMRLGITMKTRLQSFNIVLDFVDVDRVLEIVGLMGLPGHRVSTGDATLASQKATARLRLGFTVANTAPPTIAGTAEQGQTLTLDEGAWTGGPSGYTYACQRCDTTGANCAPIAGATASMYVPTSADSGSTLDVVVTGQNTVSSAPATSAATAVVP